jgi:hypothetical protein
MPMRMDVAAYGTFRDLERDALAELLNINVSGAASL